MEKYNHTDGDHVLQTTFWQWNDFTEITHPNDNVKILSSIVLP